MTNKYRRDMISMSIRTNHIFMTHVKRLSSQTNQIVGTTVLGERGQVVIPKSARDYLNLKSGDTMVVMAHNNAIVFLPKKKMEAFIKTLTAQLAV